MNSLERWLDGERMQALLVVAVPRIASALLILVGFWLLMRTTRPLLRGVLARARFADALTDMLVEGVYKGSLVVIALIMSASQLGINVAAALAGLGVAGIALGFAAQETVANMIAGFLVFWDRPFKIGDYITTLDQYGRVQEITMRTTRIRTMENTYVIIPNKQIIGDMMVNHSLNGETRINVDVGIAYKENIARARDVLLSAINAVPGVLDTPAADVVVRSLGDSSINLQVRGWIADSSRERSTRFAMTEACKVALDEAGIEIPFPHLQLFVENVSDQALRGLATLTPRAS
ncbi:MAG: mechanosensitive ion channel family protein [Gemmatimonadetes bacterium]|nr:mechanosensitive ion channel family protein [Gemmatimonadota bacterium]MCC6771724.1 mechanosensitive ion channel family protein [Gemmatimonadaceae bacterium]